MLERLLDGVGGHGGKHDKCAEDGQDLVEVICDVGIYLFLFLFFASFLLLAILLPRPLLEVALWLEVRQLFPCC